jgi:hypothetical protein
MITRWARNIIIVLVASLSFAGEVVAPAVSRAESGSGSAAPAQCAAYQPTVEVEVESAASGYRGDGESDFEDALAMAAAYIAVAKVEGCSWGQSARVPDTAKIAPERTPTARSAP